MPAPFHKQTHPCRLGLLPMARGSWLAVMVPVSSPPQVGGTERRCGQSVPAEACMVARDCPWWRFHTYPEPRQMMPHSAHLFYGHLQLYMLSRAECDHIGTTCERAPCASKPGHPHYVTAICLPLSRSFDRLKNSKSANVHPRQKQEQKQCHPHPNIKNTCCHLPCDPREG